MIAIVSIGLVITWNKLSYEISIATFFKAIYNHHIS